MIESIQKSFSAIVQREDKFTFIPIPFSPREVWGRRQNYPVTGLINNFPVRGTLGALGQDYFLRLGAKWLRDNGINPGNEVTVTLSLTGSLESDL